MRRCRINLPNRCCRLISRVAHRAYFLDGDERTRLVDFVRRVVSQRGATYPVDYAYNEFGEMVSMTTYRNESLGPDSGDVTTWFYDEASNCMTNKIYADGKGPTYSYSTDGKITRRIWARGIITDYSYDVWGNLTNTAYSDDTPTISLAYDVFGRQTEAHDAGGVTTFIYDSFGSLTNETVIGIAGTNVIERYWDDHGRTLGYALNGIRRSTLDYEPATGRIAAMLAAGSDTPFMWNYLDGSDLKSSLAYPNGLTASWQYDANNQLLQVCNTTPTNTISQYDYAYDAAGRRINMAKSGSVFDHNDSIAYGYNARSELTNAVTVVDSDYRYAYDFDDIGNRKSSVERGTNSVYSANNLNQYTAVDDFIPQFDEDGNQTLIQTATGIWQVQYNGENRPIHWSNGSTNIVMSFDRMGRRVIKNDQRFVYDGFLQVAKFELQASSFKLQAFIWDPTEPVVTRPLVWNFSTLQPFNFSTYYYTHDGNKNESEVVAENGDMAAHYEYAPFGAVITQHGVSAASNFWRFSSEYADDDTETVYYNYRHYVPMVGKWMIRDAVEESDASTQYLFVFNSSVEYVDFLGLATYNRDGTPVAPPCCCKICLYSACQKGTLNNREPLKLGWRGSELFGHSWVTLEKCDTPLDWFGKHDAIYSFGHRNGAGGKDFANGDRFASVNNFDVFQYHDLKKYDVTKICWSRTSSECRRDIKAFKSPGNCGIIDKANYCTTEALRFLKARGITPPSGVGKGCFCAKSPFENEQHDQPNPKGLAEGIVNGLSGGEKGRKIVPRKPEPKQQGR